MKHNTAAPENMAPITEISQGLTAFGLAYQLSYGLHPYRCVSLNNRALPSAITTFAPAAEVSTVPFVSTVLSEHSYTL